MVAGIDLGVSLLDISRLTCSICRAGRSARYLDVDLISGSIETRAAGRPAQVDNLLQRTPYPVILAAAAAAADPRTPRPFLRAQCVPRHRRGGGGAKVV